MLDLTDLDGARRADETVRRRLFNIVEPLRPGYRVRLLVGTDRPIPAALDGLRIGHVRWSVDGPTVHVVDAWCALLDGLPA